MKKSISINISGMLFNIEEDAYERLKRYLDEIKVYFASYDTSGEIVNDIENRIAEIFGTKVSPQKQVITLEDVDALIVQMGNIQDFAAVEASFEDPIINSGSAAHGSQAYGSTTANSQYETYKEANTGKRKLMRDEQNKMIGGVAAGIAHYMRIDPLWLRVMLVAFVAFDMFMTFALSSSALVVGYIILWIALPASTDLVEEKKIKKLYRNPEDKVIGGVAGGLGAYFGVDAVLIRILFAVGLFTGFGFLAYIILWISMPEAKSLTQRMQMQGEAVTLANIEHQVKKKIDVKEGEEESLIVRILLFPFKLLSAILSLGSAGARSFVQFAGEAIRVLLGLALSLGGFFIVLAILVSAAVLMGLSPDRYIEIFEMEAPLSILSNTIPDTLLIAALLVISIPVLYVMMLGMAMLARRWQTPKPVSWSMLAVWIIALVTTAIMLPELLLNYRTDAQHETELSFAADANETLVLKLEQGRWNNMHNIDLTIKGTPDSVVRLEKRVVSRGATSEEAQEHARLTNYPVKQQGNLLMFSNQLQLPENKPFYGQHATATLYIPYGQAFSMEYNMRNILYNTLTPWGYGTRDLDNNTFSFNQQGELECLTCPTKRLHKAANGQRQSISADGRILNFKDFDKIKVGSNYQLTVVQGQEFKVEVSGDEDELDHMEVKQQGSILSFFTENWVSDSWLKSRKNKKPAHIFVSVPSLAGLYLSGASRAQVEMEQDKPLALDMSGASEMQGKLKVEALEIDMSGSSEVSLEGSCTTLKADLSGASELQAPALKTAKAIIDLSGASEANIWVSERLNADITGGSDLTYRGNPAQANIDKSSGARARRRGD